MRQPRLPVAPRQVKSGARRFSGDVAAFGLRLRILKRMRQSPSCALGPQCPRR
ncbi:hypothetical protein D516_1222 [Rhodobacter sp. AKP1]|nr:hypothetical protein D516_1222 [Rhodobacter sp. AKP1]